MGNIVNCRRGQTLRLKLKLWEGARNVSGAVDLTGAVLSDCSPRQASPLPTPEIQLLNAAAGEIELKWNVQQTARMALGRVSRFRLCVTFPGGDSEMTGDIWINVQ